MRVTCYVADGMERETLAPIARALGRRGHHVVMEDAFDAPSDVGLYACHGNQFFDHARVRWRELPSRCSVMCLHDFGQAAESDIECFRIEGWNRFDLGLLPGPTWHELWDRARQAGIAGPSRGMRYIGWPKADVGFAMKADPAARASIRSRLGLDGRPTLLLACSWSDRSQLNELLASIDRRDFNVVARYPASAPPPEDSPWFSVLARAYEERLAAVEAARALSSVIVDDSETDLYELLVAVDLVVSNGSNILYEGVLMGVPGVSVDSWRHPAGLHGEQQVPPRIDLEGVVSGAVESLDSMITGALATRNEEVLERGLDRLVAPETRGTAATRAAKAIESCRGHQRGYGTLLQGPELHD